MAAMELLGTERPPAGAHDFGAGVPIVIAHRGASGYRPEHTLEAYRLAIAMGADYVEPDLVSTKDGVLVARHENEIAGTTDIADHPDLADRRTTKVVDGRTVTGWFTEDLTLAELRTLRARERLPQVRPASTTYDGLFEVPTFDEILELVATESARLGRPIGVCPETKHPSHFAALGLALEVPLIESLERHRMGHRTAKVFIQSFEVGNLRRLRAMTPLPLIQLVDSTGAPHDLAQVGDGRSYRDLVSPAGLEEISRYAAGVGVAKELVLPRDDAGRITQPTRLVDDAQASGLLVHVWTLRAENRFLAADFRVGTSPFASGDAIAEDVAFLEAGVDGFFTDQPDLGVRARERWLQLELVS